MSLPHPQTAVEIAEQVADGRLSAADVAEATLARIAHGDRDLNAFTVVLEDRARAEAAGVDAGERSGPLAGVPIAIKEENDVAGCVTTYGGRGNETPVAHDGEVTSRLAAAGAVIVGKTAMPEFGAWPFTESEAHGITRNPWDVSRTPGGSSGGTAAAVAAGLVPVAIGGDGGGSIRIPAASCGLFGLKPQRGRVTTAPAEHLWWALGTVGPLSRTVMDSAIVYDVIRGSLPGDRFTAGESGSFVEAARREPGRLRIGWSARPAALGVKPDREHVEALRATADLLTELGHDVFEIDPRYPDPTRAFVPQFFAGIRTEADAVEHPDRLERRTRETVRLGSWVTPKVAESAVRASERLSTKANRVFDRCDVLLTPTTAHRPPKVGVVRGGTVRMSLASMPFIAYCALWNVAGNPAASIPAGLARDGLPIGVQLVGRTDDETTLLSLAAQLEAARPFDLSGAAR